MNEKLDIDVKTLKPFTKFIYTIGILPTSYLMSMTYEEQLVWLCNYLSQTIIPTINNNGEAVKEVQDLVLELQEYINNYFDNLDVQEEINNKLDEMAESGELSEIIAQYLSLNGLITFTNVNEMKQATNLVNGSKCKTLGYNQVNDNGSSVYYIRNKTNNDVIDDKLIISLYNESLVAELINTGINNVKVFNDDIKTAIENSRILYLNNETYEITIDSTITKSNIKIIGDSSTIQSTSNVNYLFNLSNAYIENVRFIETNITNYLVNTILTGNNIKCVNCYFESTIGYSSNNITNVIFDNCEFKNYYREIHQGLGTLNNLKILNCKFTRTQNYSEPYQANNRILIYNFNGVTNPLDEDMLLLHGNNVEIKNCEFAPCNVRQVSIFNCYNVEIENNKFNSSGLDSSQIGGSDDLVSLDFVDYFKVNNNYFGSSGENEFDLLSSHYGEVKNNVFEKAYDYYTIDINYSDYVRSFDEALNNRELLKSSDVEISNNKVIDSTRYTFNIAPCNSIHIHDNDITNNTENAIIILFNDFGLNTDTNPSGLKISNLDIGRNIVKTYLGNFGRCVVRTNYGPNIIDGNSGHLSKDICMYEEQNVTADNIVYCNNNFPCMNGVAGIRTPENNYFREITHSVVRWNGSSSDRRGIDFLGNRYNSPAWNTLFYTGNYLDIYPITYVPTGDNGFDNTLTSGTIGFKSW